MNRFLPRMSALILVCTSGCNQESVDNGATATQEKRAHDLFLISKTKEGVAAKLRNPERVDYNNVHVVNARGQKIVCGTVNAANAFGGKASKQRFVGLGEAVLLEEESAEAVNEVWRDAGC